MDCAIKKMLLIYYNQNYLWLILRHAAQHVVLMLYRKCRKIPAMCCKAEYMPIDHLCKTLSLMPLPQVNPADLFIALIRICSTVKPVHSPAQFFSVRRTVNMPCVTNYVYSLQLILSGNEAIC